MQERVRNLCKQIATNEILFQFRSLTGWFILVKSHRETSRVNQKCINNDETTQKSFLKKKNLTYASIYAQPKIEKLIEKYPARVSTSELNFLLR